MDKNTLLSSEYPCKQVDFKQMASSTTYPAIVLRLDKDLSTAKGIIITLHLIKHFSRQGLCVGTMLRHKLSTHRVVYIQKILMEHIPMIGID